jgi:hypothetical protein
VTVSAEQMTWPAALAATRPSRARLAFLTLLFAGGAVFVISMAMGMPVRNAALLPLVSGSRAHRHWPIALTGLVIVLAVDTVAAFLALRRRRPTAGPLTFRGEDQTATAVEASGSRIPRPLRFQRVPTRALLLATAASVSGALLAVNLYMGLPLWNVAIWVLAPWVPVFVFEETWRYEHYGFYAIFVGLAVLQTGHLAEHTAQVAQLLMYQGDLAKSHGVFGQLDFETVHFVWDSLVWLGAGVLIYRYTSSRWLWISWIAASIHQVEHIYLFWINHFHHWFWAHGGIAGIFGHGGLIGSPLARPYLHFSYNFVVVIAMLIGFWDETRRIYDHNLARALPGLTETDLIQLTERSRRLVVGPGEPLPIGADSKVSLVICKGEVEVIGENGRLDVLGPGDVIAAGNSGGVELGIVRTSRRTELLVVPAQPPTISSGTAGRSTTFAPRP